MTSSGGKPSISSAPSSYSIPNPSARSLDPVVGSGKSAAASYWARDDVPPQRDMFDLFQGTYNSGKRRLKMYERGEFARVFEK